MSLDPIALWSMIGTWAAVLLALVALLGIIGPILVLRAVRSDRNEAINSLRDIDQDFVTHGIGVGRNFRLFHRIKVPCLVPASNSGATEDFAISRAAQKWGLKHVKGTKCRAGWARVCRLLEAYDVVNDEKGSLVLKDGHSWLPVSRFWILTLGLLGRYGRRDGKGFTFNVNALRRDLKESRMLHIQYDDNDRELTDSNPNSEVEPPKPDENSGLDVVSEDELNPDMELGQQSHRRERPRPVLQKHIIYGRTGIIELGEDFSGGKREAVKSQIRSVIFTLFNDQEMGLQTDNTNTDPGRLLMGEVLSLQQLYWLAAGFLPTSTTIDNVSQAVSLQDPLIPQFSTESYGPSDVDTDPLEHPQNGPQADVNSTVHRVYQPGIPRNRRWQAFQLTTARDRPNTILKAMHAYNMVNTTLLSFQEVPRHIARNPDERDHIQSCARECSGTSRWLSMGFTIVGHRGNQILYKRADLQRLVCDFLSLELHTWNYLTWKLDGKVWKRMMKRAMRFDRDRLQSSLTKANTVDIIEKICAVRVAKVGSEEEQNLWRKLRRAARKLERWDEVDGFHQLKTTDYLTVSQCLRSCITVCQDVLHAVSVLWITNSAFQERVKTLLEHWASKESGDMVAVEADLEHSTLTWLLTFEPATEDSNGHEKITTVQAAARRLRRHQTARIQNGANEPFEFEIIPSPSSNTGSYASLTISCDEVFLIVMWAITRCAMWEEAPDSKPLLDFVRKLSDVVQFA